MNYGIINVAVATIYEGPYRVKEAADNSPVSAIADEGLYGMVVAITGSRQQGYVPVRTFYGYDGFMDPHDLLLVDNPQLRAWEISNLMVTNGIVTDILSLPKVQGIRLISLYRGSLVQVEAYESEEYGWARVCLPDGRSGYVRNEYLVQKQFSQAGAAMPHPRSIPMNIPEVESPYNTAECYKNTLPQANIQSEPIFRQAVADTACTFLGTQYRWGGRSTAGIDCSGLTSASYLLNGILIYRDARIMEGFPVHEITIDRIRKGDLLYFPGHIAMYLGRQKYIHATGKIRKSGVVINSLAPTDPDYREDLAKQLYAAGSIF